VVMDVQTCFCASPDAARLMEDHPLPNATPQCFRGGSLNEADVWLRDLRFKQLDDTAAKLNS